MNVSPDERKWLLAVLAVAFALRAGVVWLRYDDLQADPDTYLGIAHSLQEGRGFSTPETNTPTAFRPPLYPLVLASILAFAGSTPAIGMMHVLLGTATVYLTYCLGRRLSGFRLGCAHGSWHVAEFARVHAVQRARILANSPTTHDAKSFCHTPTLALVAAALTAVDPLLVRYTAVVMTETLAAFLVALMFVAATSPTKFRPLMAGAAFGLCALCRPTMWAFGALFGVWWLWRQFRQRTSPQPTAVGTPRPVAAALWTVLATAVVVLPWGVRNWVVFDRFILTTTHGGYTLLLGNNPVFYDEVVAQPWGTVWTEESLNRWNAGLTAKFNNSPPRKLGQPQVSEPDRDRWLYQRAIENIRRQSGMFARACWLRFRRFWNVVPLGEAATGIPATLRWGTGLFNALLFAAAAYGLLKLVRNGRLFRSDRPAAVWTPLVLLIVGFTCVHLVYWSNARMRAPVIPAVALLAASGFCGRGSGRIGNDGGTATARDAPPDY